MQFPTPGWKKRQGDTVFTIKRPTENTDFLCARHISWNHGTHDFLCYKYNPPLGENGGKFDYVPRHNIWVADWRKWDDYYRSFKPSVKDPSSGTCAVYSVVERWKPDRIGLIGFDYVLDNNRDWFHDAEAELKSIERLVNIIDLRDGSEINPIRRQSC